MRLSKGNKVRPRWINCTAISFGVWRDTKAVLVVFIKTVDPAATVAKLHAAVAAHPRYILTKPGGEPSEQVDYVFAADDEGRRVSLAVAPVIVRPPSGD